MRSKRLNSIDPMKLAWLLRPDLRRGLQAGAPIPDWFKMWWSIEGIREYPEWAESISASNARLFEPLEDWPSYGIFGISPALRHIYEQRKDLQETFDLRTQTGQWQAIAWFYTHGIQEYGLTSQVSAAVVAALDEIPPFLEQPSKDVTPEITWLMYFVWLSSPDQQKNFDLRTQKGRRDYLLWFLIDGVPALRISGLVSIRWKYWLREPLEIACVPRALPRGGYLLLQRRLDLQQSFNVYAQLGATQYANWIEKWQFRDNQIAWWVEQPASISQPKTTRPFGINLIGFAFGELGIGEDVRMAAAACDAASIPYSVLNIHPGDSLRQEDEALREHVSRSGASEEAPYAINLFCLTGFDTARVALERGPQLFEGRTNVGWWPWELPVWPKQWEEALQIVDEIWAATRFTEEMYRNAVDRINSPYPSVTYMPLPASVSRLKVSSRITFHLPPEKYLFLYVFDFNSYLERKNPFAAIKAFREAFARDDLSVGLVLKTMNSQPNNPNWKQFLREVKRDSRIILFDQTLDRGDVLGLMNACDAYVSLHRSEGFGRTLAEAMLLGKPVVGTDFSGNVDFLNDAVGFPVAYEQRPVREGEYPFVINSDQAWWADALIPHAAAQMRACKETAKSEKFAQHVKNFATEQFSLKRIGGLMLSQMPRLIARGMPSH